MLRTQINIHEKLCVEFVIYKDHTKMHGQQNINLIRYFSYLPQHFLVLLQVLNTLNCKPKVFTNYVLPLNGVEELKSTIEGKFIGLTTGHFGPGSSVGIATELRPGQSGDRIPVEARFSAHVQIGPGAHPASYTMGIRSFPEVKSGRGVTLTPYSLLVP